MKLMSGREYKNDASDICGILKEEKENGRDISYSLVKEAATNLYGSWEAIPEKSRRLFSRLLSEPEDYSDILTSEQQNRELLIDFEKKYPGVENESNVDDLLDIAKQKNDKPVEETSNPHRGKHRIRDRLTGEYCWIKD